MSNGKKKTREAFEEKVTQALRNGAGAAHRMTAVGAALPPLRLAIRSTKANGEVEYLTEPNEVAKIHTQPWADTGKAYDPDVENNF